MFLECLESTLNACLYYVGYFVVSRLLLANRPFSPNSPIKARIRVKAVLTSLSAICFLPISRSSNAKSVSAYFINHCLAVLCTFLGDFWAFWERDIFFLKGWVKLRKIWNIEYLMDLENWNIKWRISRWTLNSPVPTWGSPLWGQLSGSVSNPF